MNLLIKQKCCFLEINAETYLFIHQIIHQKQKARMQSESVESTYKKVTQVQHVLLRPDTYVGSTSMIEDNMWVMQGEKIVMKKIQYVPGLYKIFDQILVNAADNYQRDRKMTRIDVKITDKSIKVENDGKTIPVQIHKEHKIYVSELIFGNLLTSSNYEDNIKKVTGGRNGYGAKLANIFSKKFVVETNDSVQKKSLRIEWKNNMRQMQQPKITMFSGKDKTSIQFFPDFSKFHMKQGFTDDMSALFKKRVYDLAGILKVKVFFNGNQINMRTFQDYVKLYVQNQEEKLIWDPQANNERWQVIIAPSEGQFQQISFVNAVCTIKGGSHVNHVTDQIVEKMTEILSKRAKDIQIKPFHVKNQIRIFVNCMIQNPAFDSQTKQTLTTKEKEFGSEYQVSKKVLKELEKNGIADKILASIRIKDTKKIDRELKKAKTDRPLIPKLQDANLAGKIHGCVLILTQGDSAKALAMSGMQILGRDKYGVYPLRGKLLNVRDLTAKQALENNQIKNMVRILGINPTKTYQNTESLRYSSVMIMADQDNDGTHIKGLVMNFFMTFWPGLVAIPGFLRIFITPIIRCQKGDRKLDFFSQNDYKNWRKANPTAEQWKVKYYKGLGTSTSEQAKQYFSNLQKHQIQLNYSDEKDKESMQLIFNKKNADLRKKWLQESETDVSLNYNNKLLKVEDFVNKEFVNFSLADNIRSIPSIMDGLKPSQRKVLYGCFKRNLKNQIKVAQLAGYIAEHTAYHHGQQSLTSTIVAMAQNFVGSNNLNLLMPIGQFGTRFLLGKDAASARYIYTSLNPLTRYLFPQADDHILQYIQQENQQIEPKYYYPILPTILINGCLGIGTGWSTTIHPHKVDQVLLMVRERLKKRYKGIMPGWQGFIGSIQIQKKGTYAVKGTYRYEQESNTVIINEIPISKSITEYKGFLEGMLKTQDNPDPDFEELREYHIGDQIQFVVSFIDGKQVRQEELQKYFKLKTTLQTTNMTLFDHQGKIKRYEEVSDILQEFYQVRIKGYTKRKEYLISRFKRENQILESKISFLDRVVQGKFKLMNKKEDWIQQLIQNKYPKFSELIQVKSTKASECGQDQQSGENSAISINKQYNYLLTMPIWSFCQQKIQELQKVKKQISTILKYYQEVTEIELWEKDLDQFEKAWNDFKEGKDMKNAADVKRDRMRRQKNSKIIVIGNGIRKTRKQNKQNNMNEFLDEDEQILRKTIRRIQPRSIGMEDYLQKTRGKNSQVKKQIISARFMNQDLQRQNQINANGQQNYLQGQQNQDKVEKENYEQQNLGKPRKRVKTDNFISRMNQQEKLEGKENSNSLEQSQNEDKLQGSQLVVQQQPLDSLLAKYLKPNGNDGMTFEQRIKARLNRAEPNFQSAYSSQKEQQEKKVQQEKKKEDHGDILLDMDFLD